MRRKYSLVCQSSKLKQSLRIALGLAGLNETLKQGYNYIFTEFCSLRPIQTDEDLLLDTDTMKKMIDSIRFFINLGSPYTEKIYYTNHYIDKSQPLSHRIITILNQESEQNSTESIESPIREYTEEDFEAAETCKEWLEIGLKHAAYLQVTHK